MDLLEAAAERAAARRRAIVSQWIASASSGENKNKTNTATSYNASTNRRPERLGIGAKPEKNRQQTMSGNVFSGMATRQKLTGEVVLKKIPQEPASVKKPAMDTSDEEDSRAKSVGKKNKM